MSSTITPNRNDYSSSSPLSRDSSADRPILRISKEDYFDRDPQFASTADYLRHKCSEFWASRVAKIGIFLVLCFVFLSSLISWTISRSNIVEVALFGDSLVANTNRDYHIVRSIESQLSTLHPDTTIYVYGSGIGGNRILDLKNRMNTDVLDRSSWKSLVTGRTAPDALVLYWDSDCSDVDETPDTQDSIRAAYESNLRYVLTQLTNRIPHVIVAGPSLYGELPRGQNSKDEMYDAYTNINRNISAEFGLTYLETRAEFFANLPTGWNQHSGYLTVDGEHHNSRGAQLVEEMFLRAIDSLEYLWDADPAL